MKLFKANIYIKLIKNQWWSTRMSLGRWTGAAGGIFGRLLSLQFLGIPRVLCLAAATSNNCHIDFQMPIRGHTIRFRALDYAFS